MAFEGVEGGRRGRGRRGGKGRHDRVTENVKGVRAVEGGRIGWPERAADVKVVVKGDPRVAGRTKRVGEGGTPCWKRVGSPAR